VRGLRTFRRKRFVVEFAGGPPGGPREDVRVAGARLDDTRHGSDRAGGNSFPGVPKRTTRTSSPSGKRSGDAEYRSQAMSAEVRSWAVEGIGENSFAHRHFYSIPHSGWKSWSQIESPKAFAGHAFNIPSQTKVRAGEARALPGHSRLFT
jgi:hypothetical protein